jgi:homoisocitrate dehydrogenase
VRSLPGLSERPGVDLIIIRENTEGLYAGRERTELEGDVPVRAVAERVITRAASLRLAQRAVELARQLNRRRLTIVHKANILPQTDGLFRDCVRRVAGEATHAGLELQVDEVLVDTAAYQLASQPERFDLLITTNLFGDILSDLAAHWCGGMGLAPSLNWGPAVAIAEPVHGSAPDIAGKGIANPIAAILSAALLARYAWDLPQVAGRIEAAVDRALWNDLPVREHRLAASCSTEEITLAVLRNLET